MFLVLFLKYLPFASLDVILFTALLAYNKKRTFKSQLKTCLSVM